jgi:hypothetical protein
MAGEAPLSHREMSGAIRADVFTQLPDVAGGLTPVMEGGQVDLSSSSFLPALARANLHRVAGQLPQLRERLIGVDQLDLSDALLVTLVQQRPALIENRQRRQLPGLVAAWLETEAGQAAKAQAQDNTPRTPDLNKI